MPKGIPPVNRTLYIGKLLARIDDHPCDASVDDGKFHDLMIKKFDTEGDLEDKEVGKLEMILRKLDSGEPEDS